MTVIAWLLGSRLGRYAALIILAAISVASAFAMVYKKGAEAERAKQRQATFRKIQLRVKSDAIIANLPADERRRRLREWAVEE